MPYDDDRTPRWVCSDCWGRYPENSRELNSGRQSWSGDHNNWSDNWDDESEYHNDWYSNNYPENQGWN